MRWLALALGVLAWHSLLAELGAAARAEPGLRWVALALAFALPVAGSFILLHGIDLRAASGRRLRLWAHLATVAPVVATVIRVPQVLPTRAVWLALFGAPLAVSLLRSARGDTEASAPPLKALPPRVLALHRWSGAVIVAFAALHFASHTSAGWSLALNTRVVDAVRLVYKQPPLEALLLLAVPTQIVTGLLLFASARDRPADGWDRLQLASGFYLAFFLAGHTLATAWLFRDLNFRSASGGASGVFSDPSFLAYYALAPLAVFAHVACGARHLLRRRLGAPGSERVAAGLLGAGAVVTLVIALALCGIHVRNDRDRPQPRPAKVSWR